MTTLTQIPFVDGVPDEGQQRLSWIRNGELLNGTDTKYGNSGNLNAFGVQLQKNIMTLVDNVEVINHLQAFTSEELERIQQILGQAGSTDLVDAVNLNTADITLLKDALAIITGETHANANDIEVLKGYVGIPLETQQPHNIFEDLLFIKNRIGNNANENINGLPDIGRPATGIMYKLDTLAVLGNQHTNQINDILTQIGNSDVAQVQAAVNQLRAELGGIPPEGTPTVYARLANIESTQTSHTGQIDALTGLYDPTLKSQVENNTAAITRIDQVQATHTTDIDALKASIDPTLKTKVDANTLAITNLQGGLTTTNQNVANLESGAMQLNGQVSQNTADLSGLKTTTARLDSDVAEAGAAVGGLNDKVTYLEAAVGATDNDGLRHRVVVLEDRMGGVTNPDPSTISGRLNAHDTAIVSLDTTVNTVYDIVGKTEETGLRWLTTNQSWAIWGNPDVSDPFYRDGLSTTTQQLKIDVEALKHAIDGGGGTGGTSMTQILRGAATALQRNTNVTNVLNPQLALIANGLQANGDTYFNEGTVVTDAILLSLDDVYTINFPSPRACFYDVDQGFLESVDNLIETRTFTAPTDAVFVRLEMEESLLPTASLVAGDWGNQGRTEPFGFVTSKDLEAAIAGLRDVSTPHKGKSIAWIYDGAHNEAWQTMVQSETQTQFLNKIVCENRLESLFTGGWYTPIEGAQLIGVNVGFIDYLLSTPLGDISNASDVYDGPATFYKMLYDLISRLITFQPNPLVFFVLPTKTGTIPGYSFVYPALNDENVGLGDYVKAIKDVAGIYSMPCFDAFSLSNIYPANVADFTLDGLVYNEDGAMRLKNGIVRLINSL